MQMLLHLIGIARVLSIGNKAVAPVNSLLSGYQGNLTQG